MTEPVTNRGGFPVKNAVYWRKQCLILEGRIKAAAGYLACSPSSIVEHSEKVGEALLKIDELRQANTDLTAAAAEVLCQLEGVSIIVDEVGQNAGIQKAIQDLQDLVLSGGGNG